MEAAQHKEPNSTCPRSVWDATNLVIHQENKVPKTWWAAEKHSHASTSTPNHTHDDDEEESEE